jgi:hypothetical protein
MRNLIHWVSQGTGTPKDKDEVNKQHVYECDGTVCVCEVMVVYYESRKPPSLMMSCLDTRLSSKDVVFNDTMTAPPS